MPKRSRGGQKPLRLCQRWAGAHQSRHTENQIAEGCWHLSIINPGGKEITQVCISSGERSTNRTTLGCISCSLIYIWTDHNLQFLVNMATFLRQVIILSAGKHPTKAEHDKWKENCVPTSSHSKSSPLFAFRCYQHPTARMNEVIHLAH